MSSVGKPFQTFAPPPPPQPTPASMQSTAYDNASPEDIAEAFVKSSSQFVDKKTGQVSLERLIAVGNRKPTGNPATDMITALALAVIQHNLLDGDLIDRSDEFLKTGGRSPKTDQSDAKKNLPVGGRGDGLQRQRIENSDKSTEQANPYAGNKDTQLAGYAQAAFSSLADKNGPDGAITHESLTLVVSGERWDGKAASKAEMNLANALLEKGTFFNQLDKGDGKLDGRITREALDKVANPHEYMSELQLVENFDNLFSKFLRPDERFVSTADIREAAGERSTTRVFSDEEKALAKALIKHTGLIPRMDSADAHQGVTDGLIGRNDLRALIASLSK